MVNQTFPWASQGQLLRLFHCLTQSVSLGLFVPIISPIVKEFLCTVFKGSSDQILSSHSAGEGEGEGEGEV